jgi:hypothetical protein
MRGASTASLDFLTALRGLCLHRSTIRFHRGAERFMACACAGKVPGNPAGRCAWCVEASDAGKPVYSHSCQWGTCS